MSRGRAWAVAGGLLAIVTAACTPDRLRPGPPSIVLEFPGGTAITSPDTVAVTVRAMDPNGLDTVSVQLADAHISLNAFARVELVDVVFFAIADSVPVGTVLEVLGTAADLTGQVTRTSAFVTVVQSTPSP